MGLIFESWSHDVIFLLTTIFTYLSYKLYRLTHFFDSLHLRRSPLWQQLCLDVKLLSFKITFFDYVEKVYSTFPKDKAMGYIQFFSPVVLVRDPQLVEKILVKDFAHFHDHGIKFDSKTNPLEGHLFNMSGAEWRALRNRLSPVFSSGKLKNMFGQVFEVTSRLLQVLPKDEEFLIRDYLSRFAIDVIGCTAFGVEAGALENPDCEFRRMATKIFRPGRKQVVKSIVRTFLPNLFTKLKIKLLEDEVNNFFFSITKQAFDHRTRTGETRGDFVDLLLQLRGRGTIEVEGSTPSDLQEEQAALQLVLTDELLTAQSFIFLAAGWETTATAMTYTLYYLAKHEDVQERLREEITSFERFDYESLKAMKYLDACISEAMRIFSPAGMLLRVCTKDYIFKPSEDSNRLSRIERGTTVVIPSHSIQRDPKNFPDPLEFRPERFLESNKQLPGTYLPFGDGPRMCIAQRFAQMEVRMAIARLVERFRIKLSPRVVEPISMEIKTFINDIRGGLWVSLEEIGSKPS